MPARRSTRLGGTRTKYTNDPFAAAGLSEDSDEEKSPKKKGKSKVEYEDDLSFSDEEFAAPQEDEEEQESAGNASEDEEEEPPESLMELDGSDEREVDAKSKPRRSRGIRQPLTVDGKIMVDDGFMHSRGMFNPQAHTGKNLNLQVNFGTDERDQLAMIYTRDRWFRGIDSIFPTRDSLNEVESFPTYGYGLTFGSDPEEVKRERTHGWDWYYDADIGGRFRKRQRLERVEEDEVRQIYMPQSMGRHTVLIGPVDNQTVIELEQNEAFNFGEAWEERNSRKMDTNASKKAPKAKQTSTQNRKVREGWIINFGHKIQAMEWAPNQPGLTQYLAVVAPISEEQKRNRTAPLEGKVAPAFRPSAPYPCTLQIWAFRAQKEDSLTKTMDMRFKPRLRLALCTDWGDLRCFAWCPMGRDTREEDEEDVQRNIGLLAGVWGDGVLRVIDVKMPRGADATEYYKVESPVFAAKPPSTLCTCLTWLSPSDIAVGCADGFVAIWNIAHSEISTPTPIPYFYHRVHATYILSVASAHPTHPHLLATVSMDGETRLTSIINPQTDVAEASRMRVTSPQINFSPILQSFVSGEENDFVRLLVIRRFFSSFAISRLPSALSTQAPSSPWHPTVLAGSTSGAVIATNPTRKLIHSKAKQMQQAWFTHEWVPGKEAGSSGVSRFLDGFRIEKAGLLRNLAGETRLVNNRVVITIYEEGTHITSLAWNPNQHCAGWASAGMGCGLVRVEDVAV
ncbi:hypothetical protein PHISCL_08839 [Aspergillus sclerotialis]|uniref:Transcription factor TFIIIC complex subunit Tfc6 n=1 Tax=Aspergillus sclerotialis TaxID=2070753 RepID=A0A3A2Z6U1_9EURO|nr:hypothetical protein PHISCL_08839 [Aspergillus sclerotialis]